MAMAGPSEGAPTTSGSRKRRPRPGLRKSRVSTAPAADDEGGLGDIENLEKVQSLQAVRRKAKGINTTDSALGKEFRRDEGGSDVEDEGGDDDKYGLQAFATEDGDAETKKQGNEEERMQKYVEERLAKEVGAPQVIAHNFLHRIVGTNGQKTYEWD